MKKMLRRINWPLVFMTLVMCWLITPAFVLLAWVGSEIARYHRKW